MSRLSEQSGPSLWTRVLFILLLSGPPKFRVRDAAASLDYAIDWVILLQLVVWIAAGCWVAFNLNARPLDLPGGARPAKFGVLSFLLFASLSLSLGFSEAPAFSAFKLYQLVITFGVVTLFARKFGLYELLNNLFYGCAFLALADAIAAFAMPGLVFVLSELGSLRFRGDLVAQTGEVSLVGLVLLLTVKSDLPKARFAFWLLILGGVLVFSLARTSYLGLLSVVILAAIRPPQIPLLRKIVVLLLISLPLVFGTLLAALNAQRLAEDVWTLSDRVGLWSYLVDATLTKGPWFGLGYFAASRIYGPEYNPNLGTAHSAFVEIYAGGGLLSLVVFLCIWVLLAARVGKLYLGRPGRLGFGVVALFCAALFLNSMGGELQADPAGFCFWCVVAAMPFLKTPAISGSPASAQTTSSGSRVISPGNPQPASASS